MGRRNRCGYAVRRVAVLTASAAVFTLFGCSDKSPEARDGDSVGLPNPSAVFCQEQGGEYLLDTGECRLADGTVRDAWEYFREHAESGDQDT